MKNEAFDKLMNNAKGRLKTWWGAEKTDRALFVMHTIKDCPEPNQYFSNLEDYWYDIPRKLAYEELKMNHTIYYGENYPGTNASLGPGSLALIIGSEPGLAWDTVWYHPCFKDLKSASIWLDPSSKYWLWTLDYTKQALQRANGQYLVELPDLIENFDTISSVCGLETLLMSTSDCPEEIHRLQDETLSVWLQAFDTLYKLIRDVDGGMSVGYFNLWAPGRVAKLQCDISAMLSAKMFDTFVAPYLVKQAEKLDYVLYHLDGPNALQHSDTIIGMDCIDAIQWQPGSAYPDAIDPMWYSLQQRILDSGKSIMIFIKPGNPTTLVSRLEAFLKTVGNRGVMFVVEQNLEDEKIAYDILNNSLKWS